MSHAKKTETQGVMTVNSGECPKMDQPLQTIGSNGTHTQTANIITVQSGAVQTRLVQSKRTDRRVL